MSRPNEYHWTFGSGCHISFPNGGDPVAESLVSINGAEGCAAISDSNGNLLFYTDGRSLYDSADVLIASNLGGHTSSANSAIIVPPAGGGSRYHVFTMDTSSAGGANTTPLRHIGIDVSGSNVTVATPRVDVIDPVYGTDWVAGESLAATSHTDCNKYWVISLDATNNEWLSILIDSDSSPSPVNVIRSPYGAPLPASNVYGMKVSSDGNMIAHANLQYPNATLGNNTPRSQSSFDLFDFDRSTGIITYHSQITELGDSPAPYGLEFSPGNQFLYFTDYQAGTLHRHTIGSSTTLSSCPHLYTRSRQIGALQLGPNGKIYGVKRGLQSLFSIDMPNASLTNSTNMSQNQIDVGFQETAKTTGGTINLNLGSSADLGLPTFTRIADDCVGGKCRDVAREVNEQLSEQQSEHVNQMPHCNAEIDAAGNPIIEELTCEPIEVPDYQPHISISWGNSECECIESDDSETMNITICNPYSNVDFSGVTLNRLRVVDGDGNPVPVLPDGTDSVELIPVGPYCFGRIKSCSCVSREFVLRNRGAVSGPYKILVEGLCFNVRTHVNTRQCFEFNICKD